MRWPLSSTRVRAVPRPRRFRPLTAPSPEVVRVAVVAGVVERDRHQVPPGTGRHPAVLLIHGGGFKGGGPTKGAVAADLAAAGFVVFSIEYRLCPPGHIEGQKSSGQFPDQTNDVRLAARAARKDPRGNGQVGGVGGSAGGTHVAMLALTGTPGDDQLDVGVCLSGAYDLSDPESLKVDIFKRNIGNYVGSTDPAKLLAASPIAYVNASAPPLFLVQANQEVMPPQQLPALAAKLLAAGVTRFQQQLTIPGELHGMASWPQVKEPVIAFLKMGFAPTAAPT